MESQKKKKQGLKKLRYFESDSSFGVWLSVLRIPQDRDFLLHLAHLSAANYYMTMYKLAIKKSQACGIETEEIQ